MIGFVSAKYALRSLFRHRRRTVLSVLGVGFGAAMALFAASWMSGAAEMQIRAACESGAGHLRIVPAGWLAERRDALRLTGWAETLAAARTLPDVVAAAPRARIKGLLAFGNRTAGAEIVGVEPLTEVRANRIVRRAKVSGRYLRPGDRGQTVIGGRLARQLDVELDDDLYVTAAGRDEIGSAMLHIVGIVRTGSRDLDAGFCHVMLADVEALTGYPGPAEISLLLGSHDAIVRARRDIAQHLTAGSAIITWQEVSPGLAANVQGDRAFTIILVGIVITVVALGIASAQLTAVLERRREFGMLSALGMRARQVAAIIVLEALAIGVCGGAVALLLGGSAAYWLATRGVNLAPLVGGEMAFEDILLDPYVYGAFGMWLIVYAFGISVVATVGASLYPAWRGTRLDPAQALRVG